jgi:predicted HTH transcriptional regulator
MYQDVIGFCSEGHSEGFILEYKHDFTSLSNEKLAKSVAASANTYGGILVIGIDAPSGKPMETNFFRIRRYMYTGKGCTLSFIMKEKHDD